MPKLPSFNDLTDINKLKEMGSSFAESATQNVGHALDKVKCGVEELTGTGSKPQNDGNPIEAKLAHILDSLDEISHAQKTLSSTVTKLRKQCHALQAELVKSEKINTDAQKPKETAAHKKASTDDSKPKKKVTPVKSTPTPPKQKND